jgi:hypothetical protein
VRLTLATGWPEPRGLARVGDRAADFRPVVTPTLYLVGDRDGCAGPDAAAGQERDFCAPFRSEVVADAGYFLHLERSELVAHKIVDWLALPAAPAKSRVKSAGVSVSIGAFHLATARPADCAPAVPQPAAYLWAWSRTAG